MDKILCLFTGHPLHVFQIGPKLMQLTFGLLKPQLPIWPSANLISRAEVLRPVELVTYFEKVINFSLLSLAHLTRAEDMLPGSKVTKAKSAFTSDIFIFAN